MKLIIDIPEGIYEALKHKEFKAKLVADNLKNAVANGKPYEERPQGEWIRSIHWDGTTNWYCSECGKKLEHGLTIEKFCYKCGADMRGKEE